MALKAVFGDRPARHDVHRRTSSTFSEHMSPQDSDGDSADDGETIETDPDALPEDIYSFAIASLIADSYHVDRLRLRGKHGCLQKRCWRILFALTLMFCMVGLQTYLVIATKMYVTPSVVQTIRIEYGLYEQVMYTDGQGVSHTYTNSHGYARGITGYFNASNFGSLLRGNREAICSISLTSPLFLIAIIFIWVVTAFSHLRSIINLAIRLFCLKTVRDLSQTLKPPTKKNEQKARDVNIYNEVIGLPLWLKITVAFFVQLPRAILCLFLMWVGMRFLIATMGLSNILLNALALEFILNLAEIFFKAVLPHQNILLTQNTYVPHIFPREDGTTEERGTCKNMFGMLALGVLAALISFVYVLRAQRVLLDFKWDVASACADFLWKENMDLAGRHR